ncbi:MAG: hypothetical protein Q8Q09_11595 [Deltaproteobacteria bacterium]|nr:hypothetical protein [Deltaproteobacteria bacterium]
MHLLPVAAAFRVRFSSPVDVGIRVRVTEMGLESARPATAPTAATPAVPDTPATPAAPPEATPPAATQPQSPTRAPRPPRLPLPPAAPDIQLRPPSIEHMRAPPILPVDTTAGIPRVRHTRVGVSSTVGALSSFVPRGSLVTIAIRTDRIRATRHARSVRRILSGIPDWQAMLGGSSLDALSDLDRIVLAAANPTAANGNPSDWFVVVKAAEGREAVLRSTIEEMFRSDHRVDADGGAPADSQTIGVHTHRVRTTSGALSAQDDAGSDAEVADAEANDSMWTIREGARLATLNRYGTERAYILLGDGTAAIALPAQVDALLAATQHRTTNRESGAAAMVLDIDGVRNLIAEAPTMHGQFPLPRRAVLTLTPTGSHRNDVTLAGRAEYEDAAHARAALAEWDYVRTRWQAMIESIPGVGLARLGASLFRQRSSVDIVQEAIGVIEFRTDGSAVVARAEWTEEQVRTVLELLPTVANLMR